MGMMTEYYHYIFTTLVSNLLKHKNNAVDYFIMTIKRVENVVVSEKQCNEQHVSTLHFILF